MTLRYLALAFALTVSAQAQQSTTPPETPPAAQQTTPPASPQTDALPDAPSTTADVRPTVVPTGPTAVIDTTMGRITCKLYDKQAPITVANFIGLAQGTKDWTDPTNQKKVHGQPFYNGTTFHRVIPGFMIQGGDRMGDGTGDAGYYFNDEISPDLAFDQPGRLAMANAGPGTNGSQFFITEAPTEHLNGKHTIFGQCDTHSVLIVATIARVDRSPEDKPLTPVVIDRITIVRDGQPMPPVPAAQAAPAAAPAAK